MAACPCGGSPPERLHGVAVIEAASQIAARMATASRNASDKAFWRALVEWWQALEVRAPQGPCETSSGRHLGDNPKYQPQGRGTTLVEHDNGYGASPGRPVVHQCGERCCCKPKVTLQFRLILHQAGDAAGEKSVGECLYVIGG